MVGFVNYVAASLHAAGLALMLNADGFVRGQPGSDDGSMTLSWWQRLAPSGAILMQEYWQQSPSNLQMRVTGGNYDQQWDAWQRLPAWCLQAGVQFVGLTLGTSDQAEYARIGAGESQRPSDPGNLGLGRSCGRLDAYPRQADNRSHQRHSQPRLIRHSRWRRACF